MSNDQATESVEERVDESAMADRRSLLTKGGAAAAIATVAGLALGREARAADGDTVNVGETHVGTTTTGFNGTSISVSNGNLEGSVIGTQSVGVDVRGVVGRNISEEGGAVGVEGQALGFAAVESIGVFGYDATGNGSGVYGQHGPTFEGSGVTALSENGPGVSAEGTTVDMKLAGSGAVEFAAESALTESSVGTPGVLARGADGSLWFCTGTDTWRELTAPPAAVSQFTPIAPYRAYDSRASEPAPGRLDAGSDRTVDVSAARDLATGAVVTPDSIPAGATAIAYNVTAIATEGVGFLAVTPGDAAAFSASSVNWTADGSNIANAGVVQVDASRAVKVFCGAGSAHFAIDVTGYWSVG